MNKNVIYLKSGLVKGWSFCDPFYNENKTLCDNFNNLYEKMFEGCCSMWGAKEKNKGNSQAKQELCDLLDKFFDLKVKIVNGFDNKQYRTKKKYREYILNYVA